MLFGAFFRFFRYENRFGLAYDQAHDALVARHAVRTLQLPLLGPFSSAGPFQTSGVWYWIIMLGTSIRLNVVPSPWILLTTLYVVAIFGIGIVGKHLINSYFGLLVSFFTAISTAQIAQSTNLTNQTPIGVLSLIVIVASLAFVNKPSDLTAWWLGFIVAFPRLYIFKG